MARLFTKHDPFHIHKILGFLVLISYLHRFVLVLLHGTAFPASEPVWFSTFCVLSHAALSWSSLLLPLPDRRNFSSPMIWPEFRLHSVSFASRHVIATVFSLNNLWPRSVLLHVLARAAVIVGTSLVASAITERYGDREKRTTNAMPYPSTVSLEQQRTVKSGYSNAQFAATKACLLPDPTMSFAPLFGIQMAALLMTLVRKGKIKSATYHRAYAASLVLGYMLVSARMVMDPQLAVLSFLVFGLPTSRIRKYMSPVYLGVLHAVYTVMICPVAIDLFVSFLKAHALDVYERHVPQLALKVTNVALARLCEYFSPLFMEESTLKIAGGISLTEGFGDSVEALILVSAMACALAPRLVALEAIS